MGVAVTSSTPSSQSAPRPSPRILHTGFQEAYNTGVSIFGWVSCPCHCPCICLCSQRLSQGRLPHCTIHFFRKSFLIICRYTYRGLIFLTCFEDDCRLRCDAVQSVSPPCSFFLKERATSIFRVEDLKVDTEGSSETSVSFYQTSLRHVTEDGGLHIRRYRTSSLTASFLFVL